MPFAPKHASGGTWKHRGTTTYVGTFSSGLFKTTNAGMTWGTLNSGLPTAYIQALAIDPRTPTTLYVAAVGTGGVFKTVNGGASWTAVSSGLTDQSVLVLAIDPGAPGTVYAGTARGGIFKSTDGGGIWNSVYSGMIGVPVQALAIDNQTPGTVYAGAMGVLKTIDGGTIWTPANTGLPNAHVQAMAMNPESPTTLYAAIPSLLGGRDYQHGGVFKTIDGGRTWSGVNKGLTNPYVQTLAIDPATPTNLYVGTEGSGVFAIQAAYDNYLPFMQRPQ